MGSEPRRGGAPNTIRVLIVDDQRTFGEALGMALGKERDLSVVEVVTDGATAVAASERHHPDVVLMDVAMPGMDGIEATRQIKLDEPDTAVIVLTGEVGDLTIGRAVQAGADGCMPKTEAVLDLAGAVRRAHNGEDLLDDEMVERSLRKLRHRRQQDASVEERLERLTPRELEILELTAAGMSSERVSNAARDEPEHAAHTRAERAHQAQGSLKARRRRDRSAARQDPGATDDEVIDVTESPAGSGSDDGQARS